MAVRQENLNFFYRHTKRERLLSDRDSSSVSSTLGRREHCQHSSHSTNFPRVWRRKSYYPWKDCWIRSTMNEYMSRKRGEGSRADWREQPFIVQRDQQTDWNRRGRREQNSYKRLEQEISLLQMVASLTDGKQQRGKNELLSSHDRNVFQVKISGECDCDRWEMDLPQRRVPKREHASVGRQRRRSTKDCQENHLGHCLGHCRMQLLKVTVLSWGNARRRNCELDKIP